MTAYLTAAIADANFPKQVVCLYIASKDVDSGHIGRKHKVKNSRQGD